MTDTIDWGTGRPAPPLRLPDADGVEHALSDLAGRAVLVTFLSHAA